MKQSRNMFSLQTWETLWSELNQERDLKSKTRAPGIWNKKMKSFPDSLDPDTDVYERVALDVTILRSYNALLLSHRVLDVGCGPGTHALHVSPYVKEVVAIDFSESMIHSLNQLTQKHQRNNIQGIQRNVEEMDFHSQQYYKQFDLVMSSLTPITCYPEGINRIMDASKNWCYLILWVQRERSNILEDCVITHFGEVPLKPQANDAMIAFNWLFSSGYFPVIHFNKTQRMRKKSVETYWEQIQNILEESQTPYSSSKKQEIQNNLLKQADSEGCIKEAWHSILGMILWKVDKTPIHPIHQ